MVPSWICFLCAKTGTPSLHFFFFSGPHLRHMEVPRLGVESELYLPAYTTATATGNLSCICNLHHSSQQRQIPDPPTKAPDRTHILMDTHWICFYCTTTGTPRSYCLLIPPLSNPDDKLWESRVCDYLLYCCIPITRIIPSTEQTINIYRLMTAKTKITGR